MSLLDVGSSPVLDPNLVLSVHNVEMAQQFSHEERGTIFAG